MLHGRLSPGLEGSPPLLLLDATSTPRNQPEQGVERLALSESTWPSSALNLDPPPGSFVLVSQVDWDSLFQRAMAIHEATVQDDDLAEYRADVKAWFNAHGEAVDELLGRAQPWLILSDYPTPVLPVPGLSTIIVPISGEAGRVSTMSLMRDVLATFTDRVAHDGAGIWSLQIDDVGLLRIPNWSFVAARERPWLIGAWSRTAVADVRQWLRRDAPTEAAGASSR